MRGADGPARPCGRPAVDAPAILGVSAMRPTLLDDVRVGPWRAKGGDAATRHTRRDNLGPDGPGASCERAAPAVASCHPEDLVMTPHALRLLPSDEDDDLDDDVPEDDEDEEVEQDEEDEEDEETWQVGSVEGVRKAPPFS